MDLILFSCRARVAGFFRQKKQQRTLLLSLGIVLAGIYSYIFTYLLHQAQLGDSVPQSPAQILEYANLFLLAIIILKGFFRRMCRRPKSYSAYIPSAL